MCSRQLFVIKNVKNDVPWKYLVEDLNEEEIIRSFYKKKLRKANLKRFKIKKVIKGNQLFVTLKNYDNLFNSWIHKKDIVM